MLVKMEKKPMFHMVNVNRLAEVVSGQKDKVLVIDSRSFLEYNTCHISESVNVCCSKLVKRRLQQDKISVKDLLSQACVADPEEDYEMFVYDQCTENASGLAEDCFLMVLLKKLVNIFKNVSLLKGGFLEFQAAHPALCDSKSMDQSHSHPTLTSISQPCMPVSNVGPTKILPFLYLGSQMDALSQDIVQMNGITYILNVSTTCVKPMFIQEGHFLRIPVNDNYSDKLLPHFYQAFQFIDKVREANGCVLVHCLAGISRSPTLAIAYVMRHLNMSTDDAYRYVKDKRPTISPNFNFLGQLLEFEKQLKSSQQSPDPTEGNQKKQRVHGLLNPTSAPVINSPSVEKPAFPFPVHLTDSSLSAQSPTSALANLTFHQPSPVNQPASASELVTSGVEKLTNDNELPFPQLPTTSLDLLNFTPCFTKEDATLHQHSSRQQQLQTLISANNGNKGKVTATKRPLSDVNTSTSSSDSGNLSSAHSNANTNNTAKVVQTQVTLRSPESRPKRPLVRPNSIAFSTYPRFDFSSAETAGVAGICSATTDNTLNNARLQTTDRLLNQAKNCQNNWEGAQLNQNPSAGATKQDQKCSKVSEQGRKKSRSLEDILNSPNEDVKCGCVGVNRVYCHSNRMLTAAEIFPQSVGLENIQCRCRGSDPQHQSSSSISSSGSHNSLQGSVEMIEVS